jgi:hypothetical protein
VLDATRGGAKPLQRNRTPSSWPSSQGRRAPAPTALRTKRHSRRAHAMSDARGRTDTREPARRERPPRSSSGSGVHRRTHDVSRETGWQRCGLASHYPYGARTVERTRSRAAARSRRSRRAMGPAARCAVLPAGLGERREADGRNGPGPAYSARRRCRVGRAREASAASHGATWCNDPPWRCRHRAPRSHGWVAPKHHVPESCALPTHPARAGSRCRDSRKAGPPIAGRTAIE